MTTRQQQDVRYWPTAEGLAALTSAALGASGSLTGPPRPNASIAECVCGRTFDAITGGSCGHCDDPDCVRACWDCSHTHWSRNPR